QQPRGALEHFELAVLQVRNLPVGLLLEVIRLAVFEGNRSHGIRKPRFLARPPQPHVAHETARTVRHPIQGPDHDLAHEDSPPAAGGRTMVSSKRSATASRSRAEPVCVGDIWMIVLR